MGYIGNPLDPWGAADPPTAYGAAFEAMAASGAYDVLVLVHDFPYRSLPSEVDDRERGGARRSSRRPRDRPEILPVYVSLTSGEPPPETKALLDTAGGGAPLLRGGGRGIPGDRRGRPLGGAPRRVDWTPGPWRASWPALAADRTSLRRRSGRRCPVALVRPRALSERESLAFLGAAGIAVTRGDPVPATRPRPSASLARSADRSRSSSTPSGSPTRATSGASRSACAATTRSTARR